MSDEDRPGLAAAYALEGVEQNRSLYADWAATYDSDFVARMGYILHLQVADVFADQPSTPVLDLGAGTGVLGQALAARGIGPIDATDLSPAMLEQAAKRGVYRACIEADLLDHLPMSDAAYGAAVSSGTFTNGHVGPDALDEVFRVVRPGGRIVLSINAVHWSAKGFEAAITRLCPSFELQDVAIYGPEATGDHAMDRAFVVSLTRP